MKGKAIDNALSEEFVKLFKRKVSSQFNEKISLSKMINYHEFRKFCGRSFGIKKSETNSLLDVLRDQGVIKLSSSGFVVLEKRFFRGVTDE